MLQRAKRAYREGDDFLMRRSVDECAERLGAVQRSFGHAAALLGRTDYLFDSLTASGKCEQVIRIEDEHLADAEDMKLEDESLDLVVAPLSLHWMNDLPGALVQINRALRPDGLLMATLPGPETLRELRASLLYAEAEHSRGVAQRIDAFTDVRDAGALLQRAGFALPVSDHDLVTVRYDSPRALVWDLRRFGAGYHMEQKARAPLSRSVWQAAVDHYAQNYSDADGRIRATFQLVSLSGWKPHSSQQKPLKPGSAKARLADALNVDERKV